MNRGDWQIERVQIPLPELPICIGEFVTDYYGDKWEVIGLGEAGEGNWHNFFSPDDSGVKGGPQTVTVKRGARTEKVPASTIRSFRGDDRRTASFFLRASLGRLKVEALEADTPEALREELEKSGLVKDIGEAMWLGEQIYKAFLGVEPT